MDTNTNDRDLFWIQDDLQNKLSLFLDSGIPYPRIFHSSQLAVVLDPENFQNNEPISGTRTDLKIAL